MQKLPRKILAAGLRAIQERVEKYSYASEAETRWASADENRRIARRRRPAWAAEE